MAGGTENSLFEGVPPGVPVRDVLRLGGLAAGPGLLQVWLRSSGERAGAVDEVGLLAVDHDPGMRAYLVGNDVAVGRRAAAFRAVASESLEVTARLGGAAAEPWFAPAGESLVLELTAGGTGADGLVIEARRGAVGPTPDSSGILVQVPDDSGWITVGRLHPRQEFDEAAFACPGANRVRLQVLSDSWLRFAGILVRSAEAPAIKRSTLTSAMQAGGVDAKAAVSAEDLLSVPMVGPDTLSLEFEAPPPAEGKEREFFLVASATVASSKVAPPARLQPPAEASPVQFALERSWPNPAAGTATIRLAVPVAARVVVEVFDLQGRRMRRLADRDFSPGDHVLEWDGRDAEGLPVRAGVYLYRMQAGGHALERKLVVLGP